MAATLPLGVSTPAPRIVALRQKRRVRDHEKWAEYPPCDMGKTKLFGRQGGPRYRPRRAAKTTFIRPTSAELLVQDSRRERSRSSMEHSQVIRGHQSRFGGTFLGWKARGEVVHSHEALEHDMWIAGGFHVLTHKPLNNPATYQTSMPRAVAHNMHNLNQREYVKGSITGCACSQ